MPTGAEVPEPGSTIALAPPPEISEQYAAWYWTVVSRYPGNSITYRLTNDSGATRFLKIVRHGWTPSVEAEAARTMWARDFLPVPDVVDTGIGAAASWLLLDGIDGVDATSALLRDDVPALVTRLAEGLCRFHQAPADVCPFPFGIDDALAVAQRRLEQGLIDPFRDFHPEHAHLSAAQAVEQLHRSRPAGEDLVVCHGDYCAPNILLRDGRVVGFVDLGELGVADRWWDLAVASWSVTWNYGADHEAAFLESYGVDADQDRIRFYRLLYDVVS